MVDFTTKTGLVIKDRLEQEQIIWLTTVDAKQTPQPRPVWFYWDGETILIFSQSDGAKVRHITRRSHVALNFNTDAYGGNVGVILGEAQVSNEPVEPTLLKAYFRKYAEGIKSIGLTPEMMSHQYSTVIRVTPQAIRGM